MQPMAQRIQASLENPGELEILYRQDPEAFREAFGAASRQAADSVTVRVWEARLGYSKPALGSDQRRLGLALLLGLGAGALVRIPALWLGDEWYYPRLAPSLVLLSLAAYFWVSRGERRGLLAGLLAVAAVAAYTFFLPGYTDSVVMALVHLPVLLWGMVGLAFAGGAWRDPGHRIRFLRYNGELLILGSLVALGGMVFSGLTVGLFELAAENSGEWYVENIGIMGVAAVPVVATYLYDVVFRRHTGIAPVLARVFAPLFLVMTTAYVAVALLGGKNPFLDREFLIIVNGLLLVVLGMTVFSIAERGESARAGWIDLVNVALLVVTLLLDLIALSAILFRLTSYGFTPNRVVVLGANLVIMIHLAWTCRGYLALVRGRGDAGAIRRAVTGYLPVYLAWAALIAFVLPVVFRFA